MYGRILAISGDGATAVIGSHSVTNWNGNTVQIMKRQPNKTWTVSSNSTVAVNGYPKKVEITKDGNTVFIFAVNKIYVRKYISNAWTTETYDIVGDPDITAENNSSAISGDGSLIMISNPGYVKYFKYTGTEITLLKELTYTVVSGNYKVVAINANNTVALIAQYSANTSPLSTDGVYVYI